MGFFRWLWQRACAWPREAWCGRFHSRDWRVIWVYAGEAALHCRRCNRHWWQLVPGVSA
jgi:hypothetical protein